MTPVAVIENLLQVNPKLAKFILAGLAVLAAASIAVTWIGQNPYPLFVAGYILGLAFLATIIAFVAGNPRMRLVLGWAVTLTFIAFLVGLVDSAIGYSGRLPTPACYVRIFFEPPQACEQRLFPAIEVASTTAPAPWRWQTTARSDAKVWLAQVDAGPAPRATPYDLGPIALQVAPGFDPQQADLLSRQLASLGWPVVDSEMVANTPERNEVRFFNPTAQADAIALAQTILAERPGSQIVVRDFSRSGLIAPPGLLEIWMIR